MKRAVSISLGSSARDKQVEIELLGEKVSIERRGTDGDIARATALFTELDGQVDALGVGGIDLWVEMGPRKLPITAAHKLVRGVRHTPVVDGGGLKNTLERQVAQVLVAELGPAYATGRVLLPVGVDRYGMTLSFFEQGYEVVCADLMFTIGRYDVHDRHSHTRALAVAASSAGRPARSLCRAAAHQHALSHGRKAE